jgi:hypothetical protein
VNLKKLWSVDEDTSTKDATHKHTDKTVYAMHSQWVEAVMESTSPLADGSVIECVVITDQSD